MSRVRVRIKERGYTLLEMLLVLILISGAGFVLLVKLPIHFEQQHLDLASTQLLEEIRDVRQAALAENNWYAMKFYYQPGDHHYQIFRQGTRVKDVYLKDGIEFIGAPGDKDGKITFNAAGRSVGTTITLTNSSGERKSVVVAPVGMRIREK
ncbi:prepilin cleavage protein [Desulfosporosinus sp. Tol-M]|jgi:prepilin-type N-terminal cleavage/methylation domain|nr:prepilin cleavage protein [Desulfosporosinus sp. Tol-M]KGP76968.1 prepilin cleavage protein [Desulfosporosinus sp. Tol-M]